jgi:aminomethyltransferase
MPLYGQELSEDVDPWAAGLEFAVNLAERSFIGAEALGRLKENPGPSRRVGLKLSGRRPARPGAKLLDRDQRIVGAVTSGTFSPTLQRPIAMGYLDKHLAIEGTTIDVDIRGSTSAAELVKLPFYRRSN